MRASCLLAELLLPLLIVGCATPRFRSTALAVDPAWEFLYVEDGHELRLDPGEGADSYPLFQSSERILLPRCSPDRRRVAFYTFNERRGELKVMDLGAGSSTASRAATTLAEIEGPMGQRMALFAPIWESDGNSLLVVDDGGIHRIAMNRRHEILLAKNGILSASVSPDGTMLAYADGTNVYVVDASGNVVASVKATSPFNKKKLDVQPVAFSPDGRRLAYAAGRYLYVLSLDAKGPDEVSQSAEAPKPREVFDMPDPIFWIQWLPAGDRLVFTTGKSIRHLRTSHTSASYGTAKGYYALYSVATEGRGLQLLYKDAELDAHLAQPDLSCDGGYVAIVSVREGKPRVVILATDRSGWTRIEEPGVCAHPSWLPPVEAPRAQGDGPVPPGHFRTVVVYPLD
jgi:Tol biopolymer transport system component